MTESAALVVEITARSRKGTLASWQSTLVPRRRDHVWIANREYSVDGIEIDPVTPVNKVTLNLSPTGNKRKAPNGSTNGNGKRSTQKARYAETTPKP